MSINSINSPIVPSFKGRYKSTEQGNPYYSTNSAMKIGGTIGGFVALGTAINLIFNNAIQKTFTNLADSEEAKKKYAQLSSNSKTAIILGGLVSLAIHLGSAAFIDYKRNEKAKQTADYVKSVGTKNAVMNSDEISLTDKGRAYYDSNTGAKYGGYLGAAAGIIQVAKSIIEQKHTNNIVTKNMEKMTAQESAIMRNAQKAGHIIGGILAVGVSALGGWLLGQWSDSIANKDAKKHA